MAVRKSKNFLPSIFQTDTNEKFLSATLDQLVSEPVLTNLYGYIGRKFAPTFKSGDSYVTEASLDRQNYQLESSVVIRDDSKNINFFSSYPDFLNKIKYYGGLINDHSRLFESEYYTFDPRVSYDKLVNFSQYYWLPDGPSAVEVNATGIDLVKTYNVTRDVATGKYIFSSNGIVDYSVILPRGGTYQFVVDQPGIPFWIQTELGISGRLSATSTISSRDVLGVENNGADSGVITFNIPQKDAQSRFTSMQTVATVDYAAPLAYSDLHNRTLSWFQTYFPQYVGITGQLDGKLLVFINQEQLNNRGEEIWTNPNVIIANTTIISGGTVGSSTVTLDSTTNISANLIVSGTGIAPNTTVISVSGANITLSSALTANAEGIYTFTSSGYDAGGVVDSTKRYGIWRVQFIDIGISDPLIRLVWTQDINIDQKVYIRYGIANANKEFYKDYDGFLYQTPLLSSLLDSIAVQDGVDPDIYSIFKIVDFNDWSINVNEDIVGQSNYSSPNGVTFTSGLKIQFGADVTPAEYQNKQYYVEGVGDLSTGIELVPVDELVTPESYIAENALNYPNDVFPEYITINRASRDRNAWSRNNRWFHREVIQLTADYRNEVAVFDQNKRATRPIIQFESNLQLFNEGRIAKKPVDILDFSVTNAFVQLEGKPYSEAFGVTLVDGMRVVFVNDIDSNVKNKVYTISLIQTEIDELGDPTGAKLIKLLRNDDSDVLPYDTVVVTQGSYKGTQWWFDGINWKQSQQKTQVQQEPLYDVFDSGFDLSTLEPTQGRSLSAYTRSSFAGTTVFRYTRSTSGVVDSVLGFPLSYRNFNTQGDIEFSNTFDSDTFTYVDDNNIVQEASINLGFLQKVVDRYTLSPRNIWTTVVEPSKQYQNIGYVYDGTSAVFPVDITPESEKSIPYTKVYKNFKYLTKDQWILLGDQIRLTQSEKFVGDGVTTEYTLSTITSTDSGVVVLINGIPKKASTTYTVTGLIIAFFTAPKQGDIIDIRVIDTPNIGDKIDILIYSKEVSEIGFYQPPLNLDLNAQNFNNVSLTLGQLRNHLVAVGQNTTELNGDILGVSNLRDVDILQQGGSILQHSAPVPYGEIFLLESQANFVDSVRYAQREYTKFKNKFLELAATLPGIQPTNPAASVDLIMAEINKVKNVSFPWFYSDMVPYGTLKNSYSYTVFDPLRTNYELTSIFNNVRLSNQAVLIYLNGNQLISGIDYTFLLDRPAVQFIRELEVEDIIDIVEYLNTDGCYVPETPTKLGLWSRYVPVKFYDNTYRNPINVIRGHDGSITPAFNDYRDDFLIELELRIYNNIKVPATNTYPNLLSVIPGKFRSTDYSFSEIIQLFGGSFQAWVGNNRLDFSQNLTFDPNDPFTWNYGGTLDRIDGEELPGSWRACYRYFYDTVYPHLFPWEMLGFTIKPSWWEEYYGPAPYTSGNKLLWDDLEAGIIRFGPRAGVAPLFKRPGLTTIIPVDENGNLLPPASLLTAQYNALRMNEAWAVGQGGPVEFTWRTSSDFPYAVQIALALAKPGKYFGTAIDTYDYNQFNATRSSADSSLAQFINFRTKRHLAQDDVLFNGQTTDSGLYRGAGYINWIADYLTSQGVNPGIKLPALLKNFQVNLAYKLAGFSDQNYLTIMAEQISPSSTNDTIVIPTENYQVYLNKSTPVSKLVYSAVIVEKSSNGYSVRGYDLNNPFFTIIPSHTNNNFYTLNVLNKSAKVYKDYQSLKVVVPYGYEFTTSQQVVDFLVSYERYLIAQGWTFDNMDEGLGKVKNWKLSSEEFLYWIQQGWAIGSILVLSPVSTEINAITVGSIADGIQDSQYASRVIDQNFKLVKNVDYEVMRSATDFKIKLTDPASVVGFIEVDLVQYEHVLVFDNSTVFNDIIYTPESGNRQYRLKLIGQKTSQWDGSLYAPGFIYTSGKVDEWVQGKDYLQGDIVSHKSGYYTALQNVVASSEFQYVYWKEISASSIQSGLLPNFSTIAAEGKVYYNSYPSIDNKKQINFSHGLIGYRPRQYLADLGLTETSQIEFYKGYIKQKGSFNAINQLINSEFNNLTSNISIYEEWAIRLGTYGAINTNPFLEIALDERSFGVNPSLAEFVGPEDINRSNGVTIFSKNQLYKSAGEFNGNIALIRTEDSNRSNDILTAGYVNIDDVDTTLFDIAEYAQLNSKLAEIGTGYLIWVAKDFTQDWNVYRITETNNHASVIYSTAVGFINIVFEKPHNLREGDIFVIKSFSAEFDAVYQVEFVGSLNIVSVRIAVGNEPTDPVEGRGIFYVLNSMRFVFMEDSRVYGQPPNGWKVGDKIWIDVDAETTAVQGQPYGTRPSRTWKVYEKTNPWEVKQSLEKSPDEYNANNGFGTSVRMSADGLIVIAGTPYSGNGIVNTFLKDYTGAFVQAAPVSSLAVNVQSFGSTVDLALDSSGRSIMAVGAPMSYGNVGYVSIYEKLANSNNYSVLQILTGNVLHTGANADTFGSSIAFNQDGKWLYVGAPGDDRVDIYGLNTFVPVRTEVISVPNENTINFVKLGREYIVKFQGNASGIWEGNITANVGDVISQDQGSGYYANATVITGNTAQTTIVAAGFTSNILSVVYTTSNTFNTTANVSVNDVYANVKPLSNVGIITTLTANTVLSDPITGAVTSIKSNLSLATGASGNVLVSSITNILPLRGVSGALANITLDQNITANSISYITQSSTGANIQVYRTVIGSNRVYGYYQNNNVFVTGANVQINGANVAKPISVDYNDLFVNGATTRIYANIAYSKPTANSIQLGFTPAIGDVNSLLITSGTRTFIPGIEYTLDHANAKILFTNAVTPLPETDLLVTQQPYYTWLESVTGNVGSNFGYALSSSYDGAQLAVGAPNDTVFVNGTPFVGAGAVYVYDRVIEAFTATGSTDFITSANIPNVHRVTIGGIETTDYNVTSTEYFNTNVKLTLSGNISATVGDFISQTIFFTANSVVTGTPGGNVVIVQPLTTRSFEKSTANLVLNGTVSNISCIGVEFAEPIKRNVVSFTEAPTVGDVVYIETNKFTLLERLIGIDSLEGGTSAIQANALFGTSLTICSNNCAIYIGAPNYNDGTNYNTGAVWKFHNRGRLYGTNNGYTHNPVFTPGDTIRLDNYEVEVSARLMPTADGSANILALSGNVVAVAGQYITQVGTGANVRVVANTGVLGSQFITVATNYAGANVAFNFGQSTAGANVIAVSGANVSAYPMASLDSLIKDINDAKLLGITAVNENNTLRLNSDSTVAKNLLRILSGTTKPGSLGVYASADLIVFAFMQIIINPFGASNEYFGSKVKLASNAYMLVIGTDRGTTRAFSTYDNGETVFDDNSTRTNDRVNSGSVYIYELYDDPRDDVEDPGRYAFAQQLNTGDLNVGDKFGYALDIEAGVITITAPGDDSVVTNGGSIYVFENQLGTRGWNLIRYQDNEVDVDSLTRLFLYSNTTNKIIENLQFIDPAKGRILGQAEQEITFKTDYDPAAYNRGNNENASINTNYFWSDNQVGQVWWNLGRVRFINYEQDTLTYRSANWGRLFPGSEIEICEWVESDWLPSQYVAQGGDGVPKYADNSAYVQITFVDPVTNIIGSKYYYWVKNKTTVDPNNPTRNIPTTTIADIIENPKNQGIPYAAVIQSNAMILFNIAEFLSGQNTILHLDYQLQANDNIIHSEYELIQRGNGTDDIPEGIVNRLVDSLSGINDEGDLVPDPKLSLADRYGIDVRPRQSMFIDRLAAMRDLVSYVNSVLIEKPVARQYNINNLFAEDPAPLATSGEYNQTVSTDIELGYLDVDVLTAGWKVLVEQDTTQDNLWTIYTLGNDKTWSISKVQSYKTSLYWQYVDWFAKKPDGTRYSLVDKLDFVVPTLVDAKKLLVESGQEILVRVSIGTTTGGWVLYVVNDQNELTIVGIENGTIQLKDSLGDFTNTDLGFGNQGYSSNRYDQNPDIEIRKIIHAIKDDIFVGELQGEFNKTFFVMINYLLSEQKFVDWVFKTSFISATHDLRTLSQFPSFVQDNQTYYQDYISEVKPYRTKLREYTLRYSGDDVYPSTVTDFDLPSYYDQTSKIFRSPSGEFDTDVTIWQTYPYNQWYNNRKFSISAINVSDPGEGYTLPPAVTILAGPGGGSGATAVAYIDASAGTVTRIEVTNGGSGYVTTPTVVINGNGTTTATAYAIIKNNQVRTFDTSLKFDRVNYVSPIEEWQPNKQYYVTQWYPTSHVGNGYVVGGNVVTHTSADGVRSAYYFTANIITGNTFVSNDYTVYSPANIKTANDRIIGYYQPTNQMPPRNLQQLVPGIEYPGVQVQGPAYNMQPFYAAETTATMTLSNSSNVSIGVGNVIVQRTPVSGTGNTKFSVASMTITAVLGSKTFEGVISSDGFLTGATQANVSVIQSPSGIWIGNLLPTNAYIEAVSVIRSGPSPFDVATYDNISYDTEGNPTISDEFLDTIIRSNYIDSALGTRAEDINVDGGAYIDRYSSHAPEELVPGITFDTLDMKIFTQSNSSVYGYRVFSNMLRDTSYLRIADDATTYLANTLSITDTAIFVANSSVLPTPDPSTKYPGVVFIGGERITYWTNTVYSPVAWSANTTFTVGSAVSYLGNNYVVTGNINAATFNYSNVSYLPSLYALGQIRRGTEGTAASNSYPVGTLVTDAGYQQQIPDLDTVDVRFVTLQFSSNITANIGDYITQPNTGAGFRVISTASNVANVAVTYIGAFKANIGQTVANTNVVTFQGNITSTYIVDVNESVTLSKTVSINNSYTLKLSSNISANIGSTITQAGSGANATILGYENVAGNLVLVTYNSASRFNLLTGNVVPSSNIAINGIYTGNIYPISSNIAGFVGLTDGGNVNVSVSTTDVAVISANTRLRQSNVWYNSGTGTVTDGTGLEGATTTSALFIKAKLAVLNSTAIKRDELVTEDAINTLITEDGLVITEE